MKKIIFLLTLAFTFNVKSSETVFPGQVASCSYLNNSNDHTEIIKKYGEECLFKMSTPAIQSPNDKFEIIINGSPERTIKETKYMTIVNDKIYREEFIGYLILKITLSTDNEENTEASSRVLYCLQQPNNLKESNFESFKKENSEHIKPNESIKSIEFYQIPIQTFLKQLLEQEVNPCIIS